MARANVPYTVYFGKARNNKGGKMMNPSEPQENPDMFVDADPPPPAKPRTRQDEPKGKRAAGGRPEHGVTKDIRNFYHLSDYDENSDQMAANESNYGVRGHRPRPPSRPSGGSEQSHDSSLGIRGRSRLRPINQGNESTERSEAVPRFGKWDENNPQLTENFTHIFNKVREERNTGAGYDSDTPRHLSYDMPERQKGRPKKCLCGLW